MSLLIPPPKEFFTERNTGYFKEFLDEVKRMNPGYEGPKNVNESQTRSYSAYNYSPGGITSGIKTGHFEKVLKYSKPLFGKAKVLDMGCADGFFLPSLAAYFPEVVCADIDLGHCDSANWLRQKIQAPNVSVLCTEGKGFEELLQKYPAYFDLIFLLEVMEHVGDPADLFPSKLRFLQELSKCLHPEGRIIITVPVMTGPRFLLQRTGLALLGMYREPLSWGEILKAGLLNETTGLEKRWWPQSHLGFNHHKLLKTLKEEFSIVDQQRLLFQQLITLQKK